VENDTDEEDENTQHHGYLYKIKHGQLHKLYCKLIQKDLYIYKGEYELKHTKLINLSGIYAQEDRTMQYDSRSYYSFALVSSSKTRVFLTDKHDEYIRWLVCMKKITGFQDITHKYEIIKVIAEGKFGIVKLAKHKETERIVAVKVIDKTNIPKADIALVKSEIEILKIAQHPNLIKLYDIVENKSKMYISKNNLLIFFSNGVLSRRRSFHLSRE
jgi:hypothetical protein